MAKQQNRSIWVLFLTAHAVLIEQIENRLAEAGLPALDWYDALWALDRAPGGKRRMHELAGYMVISRSNVTRLMDRLETAGLVARERMSEDKRGAFAVLTDEGKKMRRKMWTIYANAIDELFEQHLTAKEKIAMAQSLRKVLRHTLADDENVALIEARVA